MLNNYTNKVISESPKCFSDINQEGKCLGWGCVDWEPEEVSGEEEPAMWGGGS